MFRTEPLRAGRPTRQGVGPAEVVLTVPSRGIVLLCRPEVKRLPASQRPAPGRWSGRSLR
jgi:hypothetical protein